MEAIPTWDSIFQIQRRKELKLTKGGFAHRKIPSHFWWGKTVHILSFASVSSEEIPSCWFIRETKQGSSESAEGKLYSCSVFRLFARENSRKKFRTFSLVFMQARTVVFTYFKFNLLRKYWYLPTTHIIMYIRSVL